jgi:parafibromin
MDPLSALRLATIKKKEVRIEGENVVIDGVSYAGSTQTAFRALTKACYDLMTVVLCLQSRDMTYPEYMRLCRERKVAFVLVTEKKPLVEFLLGNSEAEGHVDRTMLASGVEATMASGSSGSVGDEGSLGGLAAHSSLSASSASAASALSSEESAGVGGGVAGVSGASSGSGGQGDWAAVDWALRREIPFRTRANVLECGNRSLKDEVFKHFALAWSQDASGGAGSGAGAGKGGAATGASVGAKRPAAAGAGTSGASAPSDAKRSRSSELPPGVRGTPIIIVPNSSSSLINMYNVQRFLEQGQWVPPDQARAAAGTTEKPTKITVRRKDGHGNDCQYYVTDTPTVLQRHEW